MVITALNVWDKKYNNHLYWHRIPFKSKPTKLQQRTVII